MKWALLLGMVAALATPSYADEIDSARMLCRAIEGGGASYCQISARNHTVTARIPAERAELHELCRSMAAEMFKEGYRFPNANWTLILELPDKPGQVIAYCPLPRA